MSHGVPIAALEDDHSHVLNAKSALLKKSKGVNKPKVNVNVEGGGRLVIREVINKKETDEDEQVGKSVLVMSCFFFWTMSLLSTILLTSP